MIKGGYAVIDFKDTDCHTTQTIKGIYDSIETAKGYNKPTLFSGLIDNNVEVSDDFVHVSISGGNFVATIGSRTVTVTADDEVTIS